MQQDEIYLKANSKCLQTSSVLFSSYITNRLAPLKMILLFGHGCFLDVKQSLEFIENWT